MPESNPFNIRPIEPDDAVDFHALRTHPKVAKQLHHLPSMEFSETETWMQKEDGYFHRLVAEKDGRIIGYTQLLDYPNPRLRHSGRIELMVHPDVWRLGVGTALLEAILDIADNWLNLTSLQLTVFTNNEPAIQLFKTFGFVEEGIRKKVAFMNGRFQDDLFMTRLRNESIYDQQRTSPAPPYPTGPRPTGKVTYRTAQKSDAQGMYQLFRLPAVSRTTLQLPSQELWRSQQRINKPLPNMVRYVAESDNKLVGMATLYPFTQPRLKHSGGLGMMVHPEYWGMGIGSKLMDLLIDSADNWLNLTRVELEVNTDNPAAVRLYEKFGFEIEGTHRYHAYGDGRMADSYFMARIK